MKRVSEVIIMGFFAALFGCGKKSEQPPALPEITSEAEEGFVDLVFEITDSQIKPDGSASFHAQGLHEGETVGLKVLLRPPWKEGTLGDNITTFQGIVLYQSTGPESDRLVRILDQLYQSSLAPKAMASDPIQFTGITLAGDPRVIQSGPVKIKLFVESEDEKKYAELYTNIDVQNARLEIREKDPEYRGLVIRALTSQ